MLNKTRLLTPGPTPLPEEVRLALAEDMVHHRKPPFKKLLGEVQLGLQELFGTTQQVLTLAASGTGAMVAAVTGLFAPGEKVIIIEGGKFGERFVEISEKHGLNTVVLNVEWGKSVSVDAVAAALNEHKDAKGVLVQVSETSTGAMHPVRELAQVTKNHDAILVADGISAVGVSPCPMDEWEIDCLLTGSQKGLMLPPGLAFIALSDKAWAKAEQADSKNFYFDLLNERKKSMENSSLFTSPVNLLVGLNVSLKLFKETGLENIFRKQWAMTCMARAAIQRMSIPLLATDLYTWGLTSVRLPDGVDGAQLLAHAADTYGAILAGGQGRLKNKIARLGHMGHVDWADVAAGLHALARSYQHVGGYIGARDYLEKGLEAYENALAE